MKIQAYLTAAAINLKRPAAAFLLLLCWTSSPLIPFAVPRRNKCWFRCESTMGLIAAYRICGPLLQRPHAAALPGRVENLSDRGFDPLIGVGDDELDAARAAPREIAKERGPERVSASDGPMSMPRISRRPSLLKPTAMITATEMIRPFWRTFR